MSAPTLILDGDRLMCGDKDAVAAALARCDAHIARANAWRRLAGYEVTP